MRRASIALAVCVFGAAVAAQAQSHNSVCIYQGMLVTRPLEWCMSNGQSTLALNQLTNPSQQEAGKVIQMLLVGAGFDPGAIDGDIGPKTKAAVKAFQRKIGLPATGELDETVITKLGAAAVERTTAWAATNPAAAGTQSEQGAGIDRNEYQAGARVAGRVAAEAAEHTAAKFKGLAIFIGLGVVALFSFLWNRRKKEPGSS